MIEAKPSTASLRPQFSRLEHNLYIVDAFAHKAFAGNPAAICLLEEPRGEKWMQHMAREMNLSETAFIVHRGDSYHLRWFTPVTEVDLCGHATLASAHLLWELEMTHPEDAITFETRSGKLVCIKDEGFIRMDFPATPERLTTAPPELRQGFGLVPDYVGRSAFDYLIEFDSEELVRQLRPNFNMLRKIEARGFIVTARSMNPKYDYVARFFAPSCGIDEDPVTGSAHCTLAGYWGQRHNKTILKGYQASDRGGEVHVELRGDRVILGGKAITVMSGKLSPALS